MRTRIRFLAMLLVSVLHYGHSFAQNDYYNQLASMETGQQWKFTPRSYYYSWDYKRVLGIKVPIPGLGVHDNGPAGVGVGGDGYVDERWRIMTPLRAATVTQSVLQGRNTEKEKNFWKDVNLRDMLVYADRSTDLPLVGAKAVTKDERDEYSQQILDNIFDIRELGEKYDEAADEIQMQYDVIREEISIVGSAHEDNARRLRNLQECNKRLKELADESSSLYQVFKTAEEPWMKELAKYNRGRFCKSK